MPGPGPRTENKVANKPQASSVYCSHKITPDRLSLPPPFSFTISICNIRCCFPHHGTYLIHAFTTYHLNFNTAP